MSALPPKADIERQLKNVCIVPIADIGPDYSTTSFASAISVAGMSRSFAVRIFNGARPADLPFEQPTFDLLGKGLVSANPSPFLQRSGISSAGSSPSQLPPKLVAHTRGYQLGPFF